MAKSKTGKRRTGARKNSMMNGFMPVCNGVLSAAALTVVLILLLAVLLKYGVAKEGIIPIANQIIKVLGIAVAAVICSFSPSRHPWFRGLLSGVMYIVVGIVVFSLIVGSVSFTLSNLLDIGMSAIIGAAIGWILGKKKE